MQKLAYSRTWSRLLGSVYEVFFLKWVNPKISLIHYYEDLKLQKTNERNYHFWLFLSIPFWFSSWMNSFLISDGFCAIYNWWYSYFLTMACLEAITLCNQHVHALKTSKTLWLSWSEILRLLKLMHVLGSGFLIKVWYTFYH